MSLLAALLFGAGLSRAAEPAWVPVPRKVLALYRREHIPGDVKDLFFLPSHQHAELPLNHLGLELEFVDADKPLPDPAKLEGVRGVLLWPPAASAFREPARVCRWLNGVLAGGGRVAIVGEVGLLESGGAAGRLSGECAAFFQALGIQPGAFRNTEPLSVSIDSATAMVGFERKPDPTERGRVPSVRLAPQAQGQLQLRFAEGEPKLTSPVAVSPRGGLALNPFWLYQNHDVDPPPTFWVTDPFAFFEKAFGVSGLPRPDLTTLNGRRVYLNHVDGDGFFNLSELDRKKLSGEIFLREILAKMEDTPFTVSLIAGYYDLQLYNDAASLELSRRVLKRSNVEPAVHGYAHPLVWRTGSVAVAIPRYRMDSRKEIVGARDLLQARILPGGPKIELMLWTGDCLPREEDLRTVDDAGLLAMNGGGGRYDRSFPSYSHLLPLSRRVGSRRQIYAPNVNENEYTDLWNGPYYGYRDAVDTFERTGAPRRVKPVNVYVHFYSAERYASLGALKTVLDWARKQPLHPVFATRYHRSVRSFFDLKVLRAGERRFRLQGGPDLRTLRFDGEAGWPDLAASRGVVGFKREGQSLYVSLDGGSERELVLAEKEAKGPRIEEANFEVDGWSASGGGARFTRRGWWKGELVLAGLAPGRAYRVVSGELDEKRTADESGRLKVEFQDSERGGAAREVRVEPAG